MNAKEKKVAPFLNLNCKTQKNKDINVLLAVIDTVLFQETYLNESIDILKTKIDEIAEEPIRNFIKKQIN